MHFVAATYNVHRCVGLDGVRALDRIATVIEELEADIVALQEVSTPDALAEAARTHMLFGETMPGYGNAIMARVPLAHVDALDLSVRGKEPRGALHVRAIMGEQSLHVIAAHLGLASKERSWQIQEILRYARGLSPLLVLGDFNEWRPGFLREIDEALGRSVPLGSFPSRWPFFPLDRIWLRGGGALRAELTVHRTALTRVASDHLPVRMRVLPARRRTDQQGAFSP
jgi:endonuclease/exonuclease/phosphatase family metal-dependent hydrolase